MDGCCTDELRIYELRSVTDSGSLFLLFVVDMRKITQNLASLSVVYERTRGARVRTHLVVLTSFKPLLTRTLIF